MQVHCKLQIQPQSKKRLTQLKLPKHYQNTLIYLEIFKMSNQNKTPSPKKSFYLTADLRGKSQSQVMSKL